MNRKNILLLVATFALICWARQNATAQVFIYNNSTNDLSTRFSPGTLEVGDEITLAGTERYLQSFSFEYWGTNTANPTAFAGAIQAEVKIYLNDGAAFNGYLSPNTVLYDSGLFAVPSPTSRSTFNFSAGSDFPTGGLFLGPGPGGSLLTNLTWSIKFSGMGATDAVGIDLYSPPVVGGNYPDYWENNGGWVLQTNSVPVSFAATMTATPEPSVFALGIGGGLALLAAHCLARRKV